MKENKIYPEQCLSLDFKFRQKRGIRQYMDLKKFMTLLLLMIAGFITYRYYQSGALSPASINRYRVGYPLTAIALFVVSYAILVVTAIPSLPLNLAAGFFWGHLAGGIYSTIGVTIGSFISFMLARWIIGQPLAGHSANKILLRVQQEFDRSGWKFLAFARMNPVFPTGLLNYASALTSISGFDFLWVSFIFMLPPSILVAYIGERLQTFTCQEPAVREILTAILGISASVTLLALIRFSAKLISRSNMASGKDEKISSGDDIQ